MPALADLLRQDQRDFLARLGHAAPERKAASAVVRMIRDRTARGLDRTGRPFKPYEASTARQKVRRGQPVSPVTLRDTNQMLDNLTITGRQSQHRRTAIVAPAPGRAQALTRFNARRGREYVGLSYREAASAEALQRAEITRIAPPGRRARQEIRITL